MSETNLTVPQPRYEYKTSTVDDSDLDGQDVGLYLSRAAINGWRVVCVQDKSDELVPVLYFIVLERQIP